MDTQLMHRHYFEGTRGTECRCGQTLDDLNTHVRQLEAENYSLRAFVAQVADQAARPHLSREALRLLGK